MADAALVEAARFERDQRLARYPDKIAQGADAERLCLDYQCWVAIANWLETDLFAGFHGGADPDSPDAPWVGWAELERAAEDAIKPLELKLAREGWFDGCPPSPTSGRRCALVRIHHVVKRRRESIDAINAAFRAEREKAAAA